MAASEGQQAWANSRRGRDPSRWQPPKLTAEQRGEITRRLADGEEPMDLALEYGVTASRIRDLR